MSYIGGGSSSGGSGDVTGPASSTDNAITRFDGTTGKAIQDYTSGAPTVSDTGQIVTANGTSGSPIIQIGSTAGNGIYGDGSRQANIVGNQGTLILQWGQTGGGGTGGSGILLSGNQVVEFMNPSNPGMVMGSNRQYMWSNSTTSVLTEDTGLARQAAGIVRVTDGSTGKGWIYDAGQSRVDANVTNATATMANITGLSATLVAGRKYAGRLVLYVANSVAADGIKVDFDGGTATMTSFRAHGTIFDTALLLSAQSAALATDFVAATVTGDAMVEIYFAFVCNAAGTFIPRVAMNAVTTGTVTVYANSHMILQDMP